MMKSKLHFGVAFFDVSKEDTAALTITSPNSLNAPAALDDGLIMPLNLEHSPVLLDSNCSIPFFLSVLLGLTIS